jgi:hypothetical protein
MHAAEALLRAEPPFSAAAHAMLSTWNIPAAPTGLFVVLGEARSGTNWLMSILRSHPAIATPETDEIFMLTSNKMWAVARRLNMSCAFCQSRGKRPHSGNEVAEDLSRFVQWARHDTEAGRVQHRGFKLMNGQAGLELSRMWDSDGFYRGNAAVTEARLQGSTSRQLPRWLLLLGCDVIAGFCSWHSHPARQAFELWLVRERVAIILLERQGVGALVSSLVHDQRG